MRIESHKSNDSITNSMPANRVAAAVLPYLLLWGKTRTPASVGLGLFNFHDQYQNGKWGQLGYTSGWLALSCVSPGVAAMATAAANLVSDAREKDGVRIARSLIYAASLWFGTREWLLAAAVSNVLVEGKDSVKEFRQGNWLEGASKAGVAAVRAYGAFDLVSNEWEGWWTKRISQEDLKRISPEDDLRTHLQRQGYSTHLKGLRLEAWRGTVTGLTFTDCDLSGGDFRGSIWTDVRITDSNLRGAVFDRAAFTDVTMENCVLTASAFFDAVAVRSKIVGSDLTDVLLMNALDQFSYERCTEHRLTKPVIGLGWNFWGVGAHTEIQKELFVEKDALIYFVDTEPTDVNLASVDAQVDQLMKGVVQDIPRQVLAKATDGPVADLRERMGRLAKHIDGVFLPGNCDDVEPAWYGQEVHEYTAMPDFKTANVVRFSLLRGAEIERVPVWGVCHGNQVINVWRGGTLQQYVGWDFITEKLSILPRLLPNIQQVASALIGEAIEAWSCHHQAIGKLGQGLHIFLQVQRRGYNIPKAVLSDDGLVMGTQFHPEVFAKEFETPAEQRNGNFFARFLDQAQNRLNARAGMDAIGNKVAAA